MLHMDLIVTYGSGAAMLEDNSDDDELLLQLLLDPRTVGIRIELPDTIHILREYDLA